MRHFQPQEQCRHVDVTLAFQLLVVAFGSLGEGF